MPFIDPRRLGAGMGNTKFLRRDQTWQEVSGGPGGGDMLKSVYDTNDNGKVNAAETVSDGTNVSTAEQVKDAVTKKHSNSLDHSNSQDHGHTNKSTLDTYSQTNENLADAVSKKHSNSLDHSNGLDHSNSLDHSNANDPDAGEKQALAGTAGTPGSGNKYVTNDDSRLTDARVPTTHDSTKHSVAYLAATAFSGLAKITVGPTPPTAPNAGDLWVDCS